MCLDEDRILLQELWKQRVFSFSPNVKFTSKKGIPELLTYSSIMPTHIYSPVLYFSANLF